MIVAGSDLLDSGLSIKSHPDSFICLNELIQFSSELFVLDGDNSDVVVQGVDLDLKVRVVVEEGAVGVTGTFELFSHVHDLILFGADLCLEVLDGGSELDISRSLRIDSLLEIGVLISVLVLESLEMVEFVLEAYNLVLKLDDLSLTLNQLGLLTLEVESLGVDELVEVVDSSQLLGDIVLKSSGLSGEVGGLSGLELVSVVELVNLFGILAVSVSEVAKLVLEVLLLRL